MRSMDSIEKSMGSTSIFLVLPQNFVKYEPLINIVYLAFSPIQIQTI